MYYIYFFRDSQLLKGLQNKPIYKKSESVRPQEFEIEEVNAGGGDSNTGYLEPTPRFPVTNNFDEVEAQPMIDSRNKNIRSTEV